MKLGGKGALLGAAALAVALALAAAIWLMPSPSEQRQSRLDERRVRDLTHVNQAIDEYVRRNGALPDGLEDLETGYGLASELADPVTGERYGYHVTGERTFELCATFATSTEDDGPAYSRTYYWRHPAGRYCHPLETESP